MHQTDDPSEGWQWVKDEVDAGRPPMVWADREQLQECSLESLSAARNSDAFPGPTRNTTFIYDFHAPVREPREAVGAAIARAVANMTGEGGDALVGTGAHSGLRGVESFADSYAGWPETFGEEMAAAMRTRSVRRG